jgi:hypothetical protein
LVTVYVVVADGVTVRVASEPPTLCVRPSDQVTLQGPTPVSAAEISVELPWQIVAEPLTAAVGSGRTVAAVVAAEDAQPLTVAMTL